MLGPVIGALRNAGEQPSSLGPGASRPGLRQLYLGYLKNMAFLCNNSTIVSKRLREFDKSDYDHFERVDPGI